MFVVLAAVIIAAAARPVEHAAEVVFEVLLITAISLAGLAALAGMAFVAVRVHRSRARNRQAILSHAPARQAVTGPLRRAIEAPRPDLAAILEREESRRQRDDL